MRYPTLMPLRVLVADDHPSVAVALCHTLSKDGFAVLPPVFRSSEVLPAALSHRPDLLLVDVEMPPRGADGIDAVAAVLAELPSLVAVCISAHVTPAIVERALDAGCRGFISKVAQVVEIPQVMRQAVEEAPVFDFRTASMLAASYHRHATSTRRSGLTPRELEVLRVVCRGGSNPEIAEQLSVSRGTVAQVLSHVFAKLEVSDRAAAAAQAVRLGLVE